MNSRNNGFILVITTILLLTAFYLCACEVEEETSIGSFGIYLADTGELVLSEHHIAVYHRDTHTLELNEDGINKWNSYMNYKTIPKLADTLYKKDFVLKISGEEIYRGKFYSMVSSASYDGVVIIDALIKLDGNNNSIRIEAGYAWPYSGSEQDPRNNPKVLNFFESKGLLK